MVSWRTGNMEHLPEESTIHAAAFILPVGRMHRQSYRPLASMGQTASTLPLRTATHCRCRFIVAQQWAGITSRGSPIRTSTGSHSTLVCSSDSLATVSCGCPLTIGMPKSFDIALLPASRTYQLGRVLRTLARIDSEQPNS